MGTIGQQPGASAPGAKPGGPSPGIPRGRGQHILCVDDDEAIVYVTTRVLERLGYRVTGFLNAPQALAAFQAKPDEFDAVVTDLSMPTMSGPELAMELRRIRPGIPLLLTSGCVRPEDVQTAQALGLADLIPKPSTVEEMGEVLHRLLGKSDGAASQQRS
jgi:CheY-like chemotaxis protein